MVDRAAVELIRVASTVTTPAAALVVVTSGSYGYRRREDGVLVGPAGRARTLECIR